MPQHNLPIVIVDDARFSNAMISRAVMRAGYTNVRCASNASGALQLMEEIPAYILLADWLMPEMDGLVLTNKVRVLDEKRGHYTYIILLTAKEGVEAMSTAFDHGVDDFINKSLMNDQLLPRIYAADRLTTLINKTIQTTNQLSREMNSLKKTNAKYQEMNVVNLVSGLGNFRYTHEKLASAIQHCETRGGATGMLYIKLQNYKEVSEHYGNSIGHEMLVSVGHRLRHLVRAIDVVTHPEHDLFMVITIQDSTDTLNSFSFKRVFEGINFKPVRTSAGFIQAKAAIVLVVVNDEPPYPQPDDLLELAGSKESEAASTQRVVTIRWPVHA